jgi:hypothetical protein
MEQSHSPATAADLVEVDLGAFVEAAHVRETKVWRSATRAGSDDPDCCRWVSYIDATDEFQPLIIIGAPLPLGD